jgi:hypothetical protein
MNLRYLNSASYALENKSRIGLLSVITLYPVKVNGVTGADVGCADVGSIIKLKTSVQANTETVLFIANLLPIGMSNHCKDLISFRSWFVSIT